MNNPETVVRLGTQDTFGLFMIRFVFCLSSSCILCAQSYHCFWIVHDSVCVLFVFLLYLVCPILPLFLDCLWFGLCFACLPPVSCLPNLTTVSGLFMIRFVFCLSSSCILCAQSYHCLRNSGKIGHTIYRRKTNKTQTESWTIQKQW
jgi:hypothetical protein